MGHLAIIGLGPGDVECLTPMARTLIAKADTIAGYPLYIEMISKLIGERETITTGMRQEIKRVEAAIAAAEGGLRVALVCSGDAGVYGMASLALQMLSQTDSELPLDIVPGVTAGVAAAALLGAPLAHDHAVISLSDLLTPLELIEKRVGLAAEADLALAIYNPAGKKRRVPMARALEILRNICGPERLVGRVRNAFREEQEIGIHTLANLPEEKIDMTTILVVGNSQTYRWKDWLITPRGYFSEERGE